MESQPQSCVTHGKKPSGPHHLHCFPLLSTVASHVASSASEEKQSPGVTGDGFGVGCGDGTGLGIGEGDGCGDGTGVGTGDGLGCGLGDGGGAKTDSRSLTRGSVSLL